jgi:alginate O-acetyltransferase complex protein AlgI
MLFNSAIFVFVFLPVVLLGLYIIGRLGAYRFALVFLVVVSGVFYGWFKAIYLPRLAILTAFFCVAASFREIARRVDSALSFLLFGIAVNLGVCRLFQIHEFLP